GDGERNQPAHSRPERSAEHGAAGLPAARRGRRHRLLGRVAPAGDGGGAGGGGAAGQRGADRRRSIGRLLRAGHWRGQRVRHGEGRGGEPGRVRRGDPHGGGGGGHVAGGGPGETAAGRGGWGAERAGCGVAGGVAVVGHVRP